MPPKKKGAKPKPTPKKKPLDPFGNTHFNKNLRNNTNPNPNPDVYGDNANSKFKTKFKTKFSTNKLGKNLPKGRNHASGIGNMGGMGSSSPGFDYDGDDESDGGDSMEMSLVAPIK